MTHTSDSERQSRFKILSLDDIKNLPAPDNGFSFDANGWLTITWGGYDYDLKEKRLDSPLKLLSWINHIGEKGWEGTTPERISALIEVVSRRNGWNLWGGA